MTKAFAEQDRARVAARLIPHDGTDLQLSNRPRSAVSLRHNFPFCAALASAVCSAQHALNLPDSAARSHGAMWIDVTLHGLLEGCWCAYSGLISKRCLSDSHSTL